MRKSGVYLERRVLHNLRGDQSRRADGHDLVVVAVKDEGRQIELLEVFSEIRLRKSLDAIVMGLCASHHALQPPALADPFRNLGAWPVVAVERKRKVLVKLRPICHKLSSQIVEHREGQTTRI